MWEAIKEALSDFSDDECSQMAAALAYYGTFSLAPLLALLVIVTGFFWAPQDVETQLSAQMRSFLGPEGTQQIKDMLASANRPDMRSWGSAVSLLALIYGATGVFVQVQSGLNRAWEVEPDPSQGGIKNFILKRLASLSMFLVLAFLMIVSIALDAILSASNAFVSKLLPGGLGAGLWQGVTLVATFVLLAALFSAIYKVLPDAKVKWRRTVPGAIAAAALFTLLKFGFGYYIGTQNLGRTFGAASSLAVILLWVYFSGMILFLGAEFSQAWAEHNGEEIIPVKGATRTRPANQDDATPRKATH